jgi:hypothetical protein
MLPVHVAREKRFRTEDFHTLRWSHIIEAVVLVEERVCVQNEVHLVVTFLTSQSFISAACVASLPAGLLCRLVAIYDTLSTMAIIYDFSFLRRGAK